MLRRVRKHAVNPTGLTQYDRGFLFNYILFFITYLLNNTQTMSNYVGVSELAITITKLLYPHPISRLRNYDC